jgi:hypothetical protein
VLAIERRGGRVGGGPAMLVRPVGKKQPLPRNRGFLVGQKKPLQPKHRLVRSAGPWLMVRSAGQPGRVPNITYRPLEFFKQIRQRSFLSAQQR